MRTVAQRLSLSVAILLAILIATPAHLQSQVQDIRLIDIQSGEVLQARKALYNGEEYFYAETKKESREYRVVVKIDNPLPSAWIERPEGITLAGPSQFKQGLLDQTVHLPTASTGVIRFFVLMDSSTSETPPAKANTIFPVQIYLARQPEVRLEHRQAACGIVNVCLTRGRPTEVAIVGTNVGEIDPNVPATGTGGPYTIRDGTLIMQRSQDQQEPLELSVKFTTTADFLSTDGLKWERRKFSSTPVLMQVTAPPIREVVIKTPGEIPAVFVNETLPVEVTATAAGVAISKGTYTVEETSADGKRRIVAVLSIPEAGSTRGMLRGVSATTRPRRRGISEQALTVWQDTTLQFNTHLRVAGYPSISGLELVRQDNRRVREAVISPAEKVTVRLTGNSLGEYDSAFVASGRGKIVPGSFEAADRDLSFQVQAGDQVTDHLMVYLLGSQVADTVLEFEVQPNERPRPLDFVAVSYFDGEKTPKSIPLRSHDLEGGHDLRRATLQFNGDGIDRSDNQYGIQYLLVNARLVDGTGQLIREGSRKVAVVPPGNSMYVVRPGYDQLSSLSIDELVDGRTKWQRNGTTLLVSVAHDPERYPNQPVATSRVRLHNQNRLLVEPVLGLPTGMLGLFRRERKEFQPDEKDSKDRTLTYEPIGVIATGTVEFAQVNSLGRKTPLRAQLGVSWLNSPFKESQNGSDSPTRDLAASLVYPIELFKVTGDVSFSVGVGTSYLMRAERWMLVLRPGFEIK